MCIYVNNHFRNASFNILKKKLSKKKKMPFWLFILQHDLEHIKQEICYAYFKNLSNFLLLLFSMQI